MIGAHQGFPNVSAAFTNEKGFIQQAWLQLLINLWTRTGAGQGNNTFNSGDIKESAVEGDQSGWLECDGRAISRIGYVSLYDVIGTTYGIGDGSSTFNIPDYRGRFLIGTNATYPLGTTGGSNSATIATINLPAHNHGVTDPGHSHTFTGASHTHTVTDPQHTHTFTGSPHSHTVSDPGHTHPSVVNASANTAGAALGSVVVGITDSSFTGVSINPATSGGTNSSSSTGITIASTTATGTNASNTTGITTQNTGSGTPLSILPAYAPVTVLIKI